MKKIFLCTLLAVFMLAAFCGCSSQGNEVNSDKAVDLYSHLSGFKGIELYVWKTKTGEIRCGMLEGTNRNKGDADFAVLYDHPVTIPKSKEILKNYQSNMYVFIQNIGSPLSKEDMQNIKAQYDELKMENLTYFFN